MVSIKHVYREANYCVIVLANDALILVRDLYIYPYFPSCIANLFYADLIVIVYPQLVNSI